MGGDPYWANVKLLLGFEGSNGATSTTDESSAAHSLSFTGNAQISTSQYKFGSSSLRVDGAGDEVLSNNSSDFLFGSGAFTVECFARWNTIEAFGALRGIVGLYDTNSQLSWLIQTTVGGGGQVIRLVESTNGTSTVAAALGVTGISTGTWYHVAIDREISGSNEIVRSYINGAMVGKTTQTISALFASTGKLSIGGVTASGSPSAQYFDGWLDELRITKGVARYASDAGFTVPIAAYPRTAVDPTPQQPQIIVCT